MTIAVERILQAVLALPDEEQLELVSALMSVVEERQARPFDEAWLDEIRRRSADDDAGLTPGSPWTEVKQRVRQSVIGG